ncbi:MAG: TIGR03118 family protein, partial [Planctomycetia bacterium 21-64-5]
QLYVTYALQDAAKETPQVGGGNGIIDIYNLDGTLAKTLASGGQLNVPDGLAMAPSGFGDFAGDLLVANSGNGEILAYNTSGVFQGALNDGPGNTSPIIIDGVRGLVFGNGSSAGDATTLFYSAANGGHGQFGEILNAFDQSLAVVPTVVTATQGSSFSGTLATLRDSDSTRGRDHVGRRHEQRRHGGVEHRRRVQHQRHAHLRLGRHLSGHGYGQRHGPERQDRHGHGQRDRHQLQPGGRDLYHHRSPGLQRLRRHFFGPQRHRQSILGQHRLGRRLDQRRHRGACRRRQRIQCHRKSHVYRGRQLCRHDHGLGKDDRQRHGGQLGHRHHRQHRRRDRSEYADRPGHHLLGHAGHIGDRRGGHLHRHLRRSHGEHLFGHHRLG